MIKIYLKNVAKLNFFHTRSEKKNFGEKNRYVKIMMMKIIDR